MGLKCVVCGDYYTKQSRESYHKFPAKAVLRSAWITATRCQKEDIKSNSAVCSRHFRQIDYDQYAWPLRKLLQDIVPSPSLSYFNPPATFHSDQIIDNSSAPNNLPDNVRESSTVQQDKTEGTGVSRETDEEENQKTVVIQTSRLFKDARYVGDLIHNDFSTPIRRKRNLQLVLDTVGQQRKKIKALQAEKSSLGRSVNNMKDLLLTLREHNLFQEEQRQTLQVTYTYILIDIIFRFTSISIIQTLRTS